METKNITVKRNNNLSCYEITVSGELFIASETVSGLRVKRNGVEVLGEIKTMIVRAVECR